MSELIYPKAGVWTHGAGYLVLESFEEVMAKLDQEFAEFTALTYEGHEFRVAIKSEAILHVSESTPERFRLELEEHLRKRGVQALSEEVHTQLGGMAQALQREIEGDKE